MGRAGSGEARRESGGVGGVDLGDGARMAVEIGVGDARRKAVRGASSSLSETVGG